MKSEASAVESPQAVPVPAAGVAALDDKYALTGGRAFMSGIHALVRLLMTQKRRDAAAGLNTGGFVSGYRGSPLGGLDQELWRQKKRLDRHDIVFQPGVNEDLAATSVWGSQQLGLSPGARRDGVFAMWYGKGPGADRCGDVFRHANAAGTAKFGGVLAVVGDDHAAKSSTMPHQTEHLFKAMMMPVLAPADVQDFLDLGVHGFALSRYSGCWVAFKAINDTVESSASVETADDRAQVRVPDDFEIPPDGLNIRWPDPPPEQERRLLEFKLYAALAYCRANRLNRVVLDSPAPRLGIIAAGKAYLDARQALDELGLDDDAAARVGLRMMKVGMPWPLEAESVHNFALGLDEILVVEEKRQLLEYQLKEQLYNWREDVRPRVIGKFDEKGEWALPHGEWLLPARMELTPAQIARVIAARIARFHDSPAIRDRLAFLERKEKSLARAPAAAVRAPFYCAGCPHNGSTRVPEGARALAGIGCHYMALWIHPGNKTFSQMGGEGAAWIGQSPFTDEKHVFVNLGDGTFFHSGSLAIRAAVAAGVSATYKILHNDAVAMTGGQPADGDASPAAISRQVAAEGARKIVVVSDAPIPNRRDFAPSCEFRPRRDMAKIQRELRAFPGVSVILYVQTCAAEKRRRRKRGILPRPARRMFINPEVCEGCGDCGEASNCVAVVPLETRLGRKRRIDQFACNQDYACADGLCPSFISVEGGEISRRSSAPPPPPSPPEPPEIPRPGPESFGVLAGGVGGAGVVTVGAVLGMAAHLDGLGVTVLGQTGLAQKGGAVMSHIRIARRQRDIHAVRLAAGEADLVLAMDAMVAAGFDSVAKIREGKTRVLLDPNPAVASDFVRDPAWRFPLDESMKILKAAAGADAVELQSAAALCEGLQGDAGSANIFLLGGAWQRGWLPVSRESLARAIEMNGAAVEKNRAAFEWGRLAAADPAAAARAAGIAAAGESEGGKFGESEGVEGVEGVVEFRAAHLEAYQDAALARRYRAWVGRVRAAEADAGGDGALARAAARGYHKLLACKDEYEVARLLSGREGMRAVRENFGDGARLTFHLSPPVFAPPESDGRPRKYAMAGWWALPALRVLAGMRRLRGTPLDLFARLPERRAERALLAEYERDMDFVLGRLRAETLPTAAKLAALPESILGFGAVKAAAMRRAAARRAELLKEIRSAGTEARP